MSKEVLAELRLLLSGGGADPPAGALPLPQLFVGAQLVAGPEALEQLVAAAAGGALADALRGAGALARLGEAGGSKCAECGGQGFVICPACRGSRKVRGAASCCACLLETLSRLLTHTDWCAPQQRARRRGCGATSVRRVQREWHGAVRMHAGGRGHVGRGHGGAGRMGAAAVGAVSCALALRSRQESCVVYRTI
jgi:hypothetical protein